MYIPVLNVNSVDPDQMPCSAESDLGLHCLQMPHLWNARLKWVNIALLLSNILNLPKILNSLPATPYHT